MENIAPAGYTSVAPWVVTPDTGKLLEFVAAAFGGVEMGRVPLEDGSIGFTVLALALTVKLPVRPAPAG